jgi:hypothetical protein
VFDPGRFEHFCRATTGDDLDVQGP